MHIQFLCPRWGSEKIPWRTFLSSVKEAGYFGIEWFPYGEKDDYQEVISLVQKFDLKYAIVMTVLNPPVEPAAYVTELSKQLIELCRLGEGIQKPLFVSAQTGREYFNDLQVADCLACCEEASRQTGIPIYQETHRNKWSYAAHVVLPILEKNPNLLLTLDISHWFCVSESYLEDQQAAVQKAIARTRHVHARVGHTQGPQVRDPAAKEYAAALEAHLAAWDQYVVQRRAAGVSQCTITPEFGPWPYLVCGNQNHAAQEEQWQLNLQMKDFLEKRYLANNFKCNGEV